MAGEDPQGIDVSDILVPLAPVERSQVKDGFDYNVGFKFAFAGVGQCGARLAYTFNQLGYNRVCAINTTAADMGSGLKIPEKAKLDLGGERGAGKDPQIAKELFANRGEDIFDLFKSSWGNDVDYVFICFGSAGGTGAGGFSDVVEAASTYMRQIRKPVKIGAIIALPKDDEGQRFAKNCLYTMTQLRPMELSPIIFIDNQRIRDMYDLGATAEHRQQNNTTASILHKFNRLAGTESDHTSFDRQDLAKLLDSGVITFATDWIEDWSNGPAISMAIRQRIRQNVLADVDLSKANKAAMVYVLNGDAIDGVKAADLDHGIATLTRTLADDSTVFPGVYRGVANDSRILALAMFGGLPLPKKRLMEIAMVAGSDRDEVDKILGV